MLRFERGYNHYVIQTSVLERLDVRKARELVDGFAPGDVPYLDLGEPSWFTNDADRRDYWVQHAPEIVRWARVHGFANPRARFGTGSHSQPTPSSGPTTRSRFSNT